MKFKNLSKILLREIHKLCELLIGKLDFLIYIVIKIELYKNFLTNFLIINNKQNLMVPEPIFFCMKNFIIQFIKF